MNWIKSIFRWLGAGSPKKPNVDYTQVDPMKCLEAFEKIAAVGGKAAYVKWSTDHWISYDADIDEYQEHSAGRLVNRWSLCAGNLEVVFSIHKTAEYIGDWTWSK